MLNYSYLSSQIESYHYEKFNYIFEKLDIRGIIEYDNFILPGTKLDIKNYFEKILLPTDKLNHYEKEFFHNLMARENLEFQDDKEYHLPSIRNGAINLFEYVDKNLNLKINPILSLSYEQIFNRNHYIRTWGFYISGIHSSGTGFHLSFDENLVNKSDVYRQLDFINQKGKIITTNRRDRSEFSDTRGSLIFQNDWLLFGAVKENLRIGYGENSQLVLSDRAPSFPALLLRLNLTDWLTVYSFHGWLLSGIKDSTKSYDTDLYQRVVEHEKYFGAHFFQFRPFHELTLNFGETIIYSDRGPYLAYMFPFLFYRSIDHMFTFGSEDSGNNGAFFLEGNLKLFKKLKLYSGLYIDELSFSRLLKGDTERNQIAGQTGVKLFDFLVDGIYLNLEYTRILPWVYSNWIPAQTYTNLNYPLGHYIGQNSDQIYFKVGYYFDSNLYFCFDMDFTRNGGISDIKNQYTPPGEKFLYGDVRKIFRAGFNVDYEYLRNLMFSFNYNYYNVKDESQTRTPDWQRGGNHYLSICLSFSFDRF